MIGYLLGAMVFLQVNEPAASVELLIPALLHGDEVRSEAGSDWWGLYTTGNTSELKRVTVSITPANDPIMDDEGEATGKQVSANTAEVPLILFKSLPEAKEGPLKTASLGLNLPFPGQMISFNVGQDDEHVAGHLAAYGTAIPSDAGPQINNYRITFHHGGFSHGESPGQTIFELEVVDPDSYLRVIWAGDLDGDNKLDLLLDLTTHYNLTIPTLFLSTKAGPGEFVGLAGQVTFSGC